MDSTTKTVLILITFTIIIVLLFRPCDDTPMNDNGEHYNNNEFNQVYHNPRVHPYSRDVVFRPDSGYRVIDDHSSHKIWDHIDDQNDAMGARTTRRFNPMIKRVKFADESSHDANVRRSDVPPGNPHVRNVDIRTSHDDTHIDRNRVLDTNNISGFCVQDESVDDDSAAYSDVIHDDFDMDMDMDDQTYQTMMLFRPRMKTYIEADQNTGRYDPNQGKGKQDIKGLKELEHVINGYRDNTMNSIQGNYRDRNHYHGKVKMYDNVV